ncbi:MAG: hypothetical protein V4609_19370 [Pseudomonadota bacterium]
MVAACLRLLHVSVMVVGTLIGQAAFAGDAASLRARYGEVRNALRDNGLRHPLTIESVESGDTLRGKVSAVLEHPYETVRVALRDPANWCDLMVLPFNNKYCRVTQGAGGPVLAMRIGRRHDQPPEQAFALDFAFRKVSDAPDYFESQLQADVGPLGTRDYRIVVSAIALDSRRTFFELDYAYSFGVTGRTMMKVYLATAGARRVGFTVVGRTSDGQPQYIGGVRGAVERSAMRHYLAVDAYLDSLALPPERRIEARIGQWFDASEAYPRQLHEMEREVYLNLKRQDIERQRRPL